MRAGLVAYSLAYYKRSCHREGECGYLINMDIPWAAIQPSFQRVLYRNTTRHFRIISTRKSLAGTEFPVTDLLQRYAKAVETEDANGFLSIQLRQVENA